MERFIFRFLKIGNETAFTPGRDEPKLEKLLVRHVCFFCVEFGEDPAAEAEEAAGVREWRRRRRRRIGTKIGCGGGAERTRRKHN